MSMCKSLIKRILWILWDLVLSLIVNFIVVTFIIALIYAIMSARGWLLTDNPQYWRDGIVTTTCVATAYDLVANAIKRIKGKRCRRERE